MEIKKYVLKNTHGMTVTVLNYGGIVSSMLVPDKDGKFANVVLGFEDLEQYQRSNPSYLGALIGRYANRISKAKFKIEGATYHVPQNDGANGLHGGIKGFDKVFWEVKEKENALSLSYLSRDGEEGFPGNLQVEVTYSLNEKNEFRIDYQATTDQTTALNLTHHGYFNLTGKKKTTIVDHELFIDASSYTESDAAYLPTGKQVPVEGVTDFRDPRKIGIHFEEGYNHNYVLNQSGLDHVAARLRDPLSGRTMEVLTTEPGLQLYTGYFLETPYSGVALEAQHFPDSVNRKEFPTTLLNPGETYRQTTVYRFA